MSGRAATVRGGWANLGTSFPTISYRLHPMRIQLFPLALLAFPSLASLAPDSSAQSCFQGIRLLPSQVKHLYHVGEAVALTPEWAAVGDWAAYASSEPQLGRGRVNLYSRDPVDGELVFHRQLGNDLDSSPSDWYGWDLDLHESTLAVGVMGHGHTPGDQAGAVFLYEWTGQDWVFTERVRAPAATAPNQFGAGVDVNDDWLAVRAIAGLELYIYRRTAAGAIHHTTITLESEFSPLGSQPGAAGVRLAGDHLLVTGWSGVRVYEFDAALQTWSTSVERLGTCCTVAHELAEEGLFWADYSGVQFIPRDPVTGAWGMVELISAGNYTESLAYANGQLGVYGADPATFPIAQNAVRAFRRGPSGWMQVGVELFHGYRTERSLATDGRRFLIGHLEGGLFDFECGNIGVRECVQAPGNLTGMSGDLIALGSTSVADNDLELVASYLPTGQFGAFLVSSILSSSVNPTGSAGTLCVGAFSRFFDGPGQVQRVNVSGELRLRVDLGAIPVLFGTTAVVPGDTWYFQSWYRGWQGFPTSRFTSALSVTFD